MKPRFDDIRNRIKEEPKWYDENGTPRYDKFSPKLTSNIYSSQVVLLKIECQNCSKAFLVELNWDLMKDVFSFRKDDLKKQILEESIHYGDPPQHGCTGNTMNCDDIKVIEFWERDKRMNWKRMKKYERKVE